MKVTITDFGDYVEKLCEPDDPPTATPNDGADNKSNEGQTAGSSFGRCYVITNLATVKPRAYRWIWPGHLLRGGLELVAGVPGIGKSQIHCQYATYATTGRAWPNGMPGITPCRVIILTAEDNTANTLVPRLLAAGADLSRITQLDAIRRNNRDEMFLLNEDLLVLEQLIQDLGEVGLVLIDPITAYMGHNKHFDSHRATDVRSQLGPLKTLAERTDVAFSAVTHPPKRASQQALDHFIGSQAFIAAARVGHLCVAEMETDDDGGNIKTGRQLFTNVKPSPGTPMQPTLIYRLDVVETGYDPDGTLITAPVVRWEGESMLTADEALAAAKPRKGRSAVQNFLLTILADGPVLQTTIAERGAKHGFSCDQLWRTKQTLGIKAFKQRGGDFNAPWLWALPEHATQEA